MAVLLSGCVSQSAQKLSPATYYRNDICFKLGKQSLWKRIKYRNGNNPDKNVDFCGVGVLPAQDKYKFEVQSYGKLDYFAMTTCHEEVTTENPDRGIFKKDGRVYVEYSPTLEKSLHCPLFIAAYNKKQRHAWGVIAFENPEYKLSAKLECNGYITDSIGVSACQSREGLVQKITFNEPVKLVSPVSGASDRKSECPVIGKDNATEIVYKIPNRECVYGFIGLNSKKIHQHYTFGYEEIIIRD